MSSPSNLLDEINDMLLDSDLSQSLTPAEVRIAARYFGINKVASGETIFKEGDAGMFMCVVHSGNVSVRKASESGQPVEMAKISHGRALGEMAVLDGERRSATCVAISDCELLTLSKESMDKMLEEQPRTGAKVLRTIAVSLSRRLRMAVGKLVDYEV